MKIGIEVEGLYKGLSAIFCDAGAPLVEVRNQAIKNKVDLVYISDNGNLLDYEFVGEFFKDFTVTLDVTGVTGYRPPNVNLMLRIDRGDMHFDVVHELVEGDQVKFEINRNVVVFPMTAAIRTKPSDFDGDVEI